MAGASNPQAQDIFAVFQELFDLMKVFPADFG